MSTANEITRLGNAKSAIAAAIANKGVTVPATTKLDGMASLIGQIKTGGGAEMVTGTIGGMYTPIIWYVDSSGRVQTLWSGGSLTCPKNSFLLADEATTDSAVTSNCSLLSVYTIDNGYLANKLLLFQVTGNNFSITF